MQEKWHSGNWKGQPKVLYPQCNCFPWQDQDYAVCKKCASENRNRKVSRIKVQSRLVGMWTNSAKVFLEGIRRVLLFGVVDSWHKRFFFNQSLPKKKKNTILASNRNKKIPRKLASRYFKRSKNYLPKTSLAKPMASWHVSAATRTDPRAFCKDTWRHVRVPWYHGVKCRQFF